MLVRGVGDRNNEKAAQLEHQVCDLSKEQGYDSCVIDLRQYVKLEYSDLFEEKHTEYFYVRPVSGGRHISSKDGHEWVDDFWAKYWERGGIEFYNTTPKQILERVKTASLKPKP